MVTSPLDQIAVACEAWVCRGAVDKGILEKVWCEDVIVSTTPDKIAAETIEPQMFLVAAASRRFLMESLGEEEASSCNIDKMQ